MRRAAPQDHETSQEEGAEIGGLQAVGPTEDGLRQRTRSRPQQAEQFQSHERQSRAVDPNRSRTRVRLGELEAEVKVARGQEGDAHRVEQEQAPVDGVEASRVGDRVNDEEEPAQGGEVQPQRFARTSHGHQGAEAETEEAHQPEIGVKPPIARGERDRLEVGAGLRAVTLYSIFNVRAGHNRP